MFNAARFSFRSLCRGVRRDPRGYRKRGQHRASALKRSGPVFRSFGAIPPRSRVRASAGPDDLRRARTPADPIRSRPTAVGPDRTDLAPHRNTERHGGRRRLRVRHRRPGQRRQGRRGDREHRLLRADPVAHPHAHAVVPAGADAHPYAPAAAETAVAHAHPGAHAGSPARPEADAAATTEARTAATSTAAARAGGAPARPRPDSPAEAETLAEPTPEGVADPGELPAVPGPVPRAGQALRTVARLTRPARHRARGVRRRGPASALIPGGTSCRNGLFSPSRWGRPVWSSSSWP